MTFIESLIVALTTMMIVFIVLCALYLVMVLFSVVFYGAKRARTADGVGNAPHS